MSAPRLSDGEQAEIVAAYRANEPVATIAARFGVDATYPRVLARRRGVEPRVPRADPTRRHPTIRWVLARARRRRSLARRAAAREAGTAKTARARVRQARITAALAELDDAGRACFVRCRKGAMPIGQALSIAREDHQIRKGRPS